MQIGTRGCYPVGERPARRWRRRATPRHDLGADPRAGESHVTIDDQRPARRVAGVPIAKARRSARHLSPVVKGARIVDILRIANDVAPDLSVWLSGIAEAPFDFTGTLPVHQSAYNHRHLWMLEWWADYDRRIDVAFRHRAVAWIFRQWTRRLVSYRPYQTMGYRLYLYEDVAPTVSVVAETPAGFPYGGQPSFVASMDDVLRLYAGRSWRVALGIDERSPQLTPQRLLTIIEDQHGSIGRPVADSLSVTQAQTRRLIELWDLGHDVNRIRKRFHRPPAQFCTEEQILHRYKVYEERLPPNY